MVSKFVLGWQFVKLEAIQQDVLVNAFLHFQLIDQKSSVLLPRYKVDRPYLFAIEADFGDRFNETNYENHATRISQRTI